MKSGSIAYAVSAGSYLICIYRNCNLLCICPCGVACWALRHAWDSARSTMRCVQAAARLPSVMSGTIRSVRMPYVLFAMSAALGHVCLRSRPDVAEGDALEAFFFLQQQMGELTAAAADALRGQVPVTANAQRRIEHHANEAIAGISALVAAVAARVPKREG